MRLPHRLQGQKVKSQGHGAGAYCGGHLAAQLVTYDVKRTERNRYEYSLHTVEIRIHIPIHIHIHIHIKFKTTANIH